MNDTKNKKEIQKLYNDFKGFLSQVTKEDVEEDLWEQFTDYMDGKYNDSADWNEEYTDRSIL